MNFICQPCQNKDHGQCPGGTHCHCQHRTEARTIIKKTGE